MYCYNVKPGVSIDYATGESRFPMMVVLQQEVRKEI